MKEGILSKVFGSKNSQIEKKKVVLADEIEKLEAYLGNVKAPYSGWEGAPHDDATKVIMKKREILAAKRQELLELTQLN